MSDVAGKVSEPRPERRVSKSRRHRARECAVEALYQLDLLKDEPAQVVRELIRRKRPAPAIAKFFNRLFDRVVAEREAIDAVLIPTLRRWRLERLAYVDRAILRMAICELMFFKGTPPVVVISEAVELAKEYSNEEAGRFVNGVLDAVAHTLCGENLSARRRE